MSFLSAAGPVHSAIYACPSEGGGKIFQDRPCGDTPKPAIESTDNQAPSDEDENRARPDLPKNMHESWFDRPSLATNHVWCDRTGCECGPLERTFSGGITQAVTDALFLDGGWHRYATKAEELKGVIKNSFEYQQIRVDIDAAACDIMMSQFILKRYGDKQLKQLEQAAATAEQMGYADPTRCDDGQREGCKQLKAYERIELIRADLLTLKLARPTITRHSPLD